MAQSSIEWTELTWNPVTGCTKVSQGCKFCYAEIMARRLQAMGFDKYKNGFNVTTHPEALDEPYKWKKSKVVFVNSMSDLFHPDVPIGFILQVFKVMRENPQHVFQVLTKRTELLLEYDNAGLLEWAENIWMGTSVEDERVKNRIDTLRKTKAATKLLSCEPLIEDQARNIRSMYSKLAGNYPREVSTITITPFEGSSKNKYLIERGCIMSIGSAQQPDSLRSFDLAMLHLSEVGLWKQTAGKSPEDLVQALIGALARGRNTLLVEESTAKGVGNYFHRRWQASVNGQNNSLPVFIPWHKIDMYRLTKKEINDNYGNYEKFVESWTEYERFLWSEGATIEGIAWYRWQLDEYDGDSWRMQSEFPTTAQEAFQSTGRRVFHPAYVLNLRKHTRDPVAIGNLEGDGQTGPGSLQNIRFVPSKNGHLWIWKFPEDIEPPRPVRNMTCGFADIGGRTKTADKSTLKIFNRYWMMEGGLPEVVAEYRGNLDQDIFAWDAVRLCKWYFNALLAVEINSLRTKHSDTEGEHGYTILDEIKEHYDNLFYRTQPGSIVDRAPTRILGFHTGKGTKEMIVNRLNAAARDTEYIERSSRTCDEMDSYEIKPDGTMGAVEGAKDDLVISTAGGVWLATSYMSHPKMIRSGTGKRLRQRKTEAVI